MHHPLTTFQINFQSAFPSVVAVTRTLVPVVTVPSITSPNPSAADETAYVDHITDTTAPAVKAFSPARIATNAHPAEQNDVIENINAPTKAQKTTFSARFF